MKKKKAVHLGTTLFEAVFVCSFIGMLFLLLYKSLEVSMKTNYSVFNGDSVVKQSAFSFEEIITKRVRETEAEAISIFNEISHRQYIDTDTDSSKTQAQITETQKITSAISFPGHYPNWTPSQVVPFDELSTELGIEKIPDIPDDMNDKDLTVYNYDSVFIYYYDREGNWDSEILGRPKKSADERSLWPLKYTMYEIVLKINPDTFQKKMSSAPKISKLKEFLKNKFSSGSYNRGDSYIKYRKISQNLVYFSADMSTYPLINFKSMFMYGRGGNSSRQVIEDSGNKAISEVFELSFSAMPYYY